MHHCDQSLVTTLIDWTIDARDAIAQRIHDAESQAATAQTADSHPANNPSASLWPEGTVYPFTSTAFLVLPTPVPVEDIFASPWILSAIRMGSRTILSLETLPATLMLFLNLQFLIPHSWFVLSVFLLVFLLVLLSVFLSRSILLRQGYTTVFGIPISGRRRLFWAMIQFPQKTWVRSRCVLDFIY